MSLEFEWDDHKNNINIQKHGLSFDLAAEIFNDPNLLQILDYREQDKENRFICVGKTGFGVVLVVIITQRNGKKE